MTPHLNHFQLLDIGGRPGNTVGARCRCFRLMFTVKPSSGCRSLGYDGGAKIGWL